MAHITYSLSKTSEPSQHVLPAPDPSLHSVLEALPPVAAAFAYGSGVFHQPGLYQRKSSDPGPMIDFVLTVEDPVEWHRLNLERNADHYSCFGRLGPQTVRRVVLGGVAQSLLSEMQWAA